MVVNIPVQQNSLNAPVEELETTLTQQLKKRFSRSYNDSLHTLMLADVLLVGLASQLIGQQMGVTNPVFYTLSICLFVATTYLMRSYALTENHYIVSKIMMQWAGVGLLQGGLMAYMGATFSQSALVAFTFVGVGLLPMLYHALLSRKWSLPQRSAQLYKRVELGIKRVFDVAMSTATALVIVPILLVVSALIWLHDRGPVLYAQERVGEGEQSFEMLKFRTMVVDADKALEKKARNKKALFKNANDPRITPLGFWLRKLSIDELPQLINIFNGEMSLVGPRPPLKSEYEQMESAHRNKFNAKPGLTGLWQVEGRVRDQRDFDSVASYDNEYIRNWSFALDLEIILKTIPVVLFQKGAC
ncbi:MAG: sugar transferase [Cyanobacteria bacterium HKST-UBA04]|nr:sugar transferase [Cyanobacteria bacterium HKST-UBA04]